MKCLLFLFSFLIPISLYAEWTPENPRDVTGIYDAADKFAREGNYAESNRRYEWLYRNIEKYQPGYSGVKNSFMLSNWVSVASKYAPAKNSLGKLLNEYIALVDSSPREHISLIRDVQSILEYTGNSERALEFFKRIENKDPVVARGNAIYFRLTFLRLKSFDCMSRYFDPEQEFLRAIDSYGLSRYLKIRGVSEIKIEEERIRDNFRDGVSFAVAILVYEGDQGKAKKWIETAGQIDDSKDFAIRLKTLLQDPNTLDSSLLRFQQKLDFE